MTTTTVQIIHNATHAKLITDDKSIRRSVSAMLSYKVAGSEHMGGGSWDGSSSFYEMRKDRFPAGFVRLVKKRLEASKIRVLVKSKEVPKPLGPVAPVVDSFPADPRYDYQDETMIRQIKMRGMIAQVATGGGKSRIFKLCCERIGRPTLFITTRKSLMYQMAEAYENDLGKPAGILGDGQWSPKPTGVNFAIVDTLVSRLEQKSYSVELDKAVEKIIEKAEKQVQKKLTDLGLPSNLKVVRNVPKAILDKVTKLRESIYATHTGNKENLQTEISAKVIRHNERREETIEFLRKIEFLAIEEAHEVSGNGFYDIAMTCENAYYRLALTATPFMKDDEEANMRLMAVTGVIGIKVSEKLLIDRGILAKPYFVYLDSHSPKNQAGHPVVMRSTPYSKAYAKGISENLDRNMVIARQVHNAKRHGLTAMILVQHTKHGKALEVIMNNLGIKTRFIHGAHEQKERASALRELGDGQLDCLIGSTILDVGVDVPSVGMVGLAGGGKAEVSIRQRIGRGLRFKKTGPNVVLVFDFNDNFNNHLARHSKERRRIIADTPGFAENVVSKFDYRALGFTKR